MVLLNSVLNDILIFFMSLMKMSMFIWKKLIRLQICFFREDQTGVVKFLGLSGRMSVNRRS